MSQRGEAWRGPDWFQVALTSIGDAVIITDEHGRVTFMNPVAESLTGWTQAEAAGAPLETVFRIISEESRQPVEGPAARVLRKGVVVGLANPTLLVARDGSECAVDDSAAPIRASGGNVCGVVLVFRDIGDRRRMERLIADAWSYAEAIVATVREPLVVLDAHLRVKSASRSFYQTFHVTPEETENRLLSELGAGQWDSPALRTLLQEVLPQGTSFQDFEVARTFPALGRRTMLLSARRLYWPGNPLGMILVAIEDVTERRRAEEALKEADRHKDEFLALLGHELRHPLAPIRNALHLIRLRGQGTREEALRTYDLIERQVEHLARLVDDLLDVSRINRARSNSAESAWTWRSWWPVPSRAVGRSSTRGDTGWKWRCPVPPWRWRRTRCG
jgi:PAS domain S-box-containing protein